MEVCSKATVIESVKYESDSSNAIKPTVATEKYTDPKGSNKVASNESTEKTAAYEPCKEDGARK